MKTLVAVSLAALGLVLFSQGSARAGTLDTPLISVDAAPAGKYFNCNVRNVSNRNLDIAVAFVVGGVLGLPSSCTSVIPNGECSFPLSAFAGARAACKVTVSGGKDSVRVSLELMDSTGTPIVVVDAR